MSNLIQMFLYWLKSNNNLFTNKTGRTEKTYWIDVTREAPDVCFYSWGDGSPVANASWYSREPTCMTDEFVGRFNFRDSQFSIFDSDQSRLNGYICSISI